MDLEGGRRSAAGQSVLGSVESTSAQQSRAGSCKKQAAGVDAMQCATHETQQKRQELRQRSQDQDQEQCSA